MYIKLLRSSSLRAAMARFPLLCGMDCYFLDSLGNVSLTAPRQPANPFIRLLHTQEETRRLLQKNRQALLAGDVAEVNDGGYHELVYRLTLETETIGYLMLSAARGDDRDRQATRQTWVRLAGQGSGISWSAWSKCWLTLPEQTAEQREAWRHTLALYAHEALRQLETDLHPEPQTLPALVRRACVHIRQRHTGPLHLKAVARELGVSAEHLSRLFHQSTGLRFREYLAETRVETACEALVHSARPIAEIAHEAGFATLSRFNRCFRTHRDMTPRDWRKRSRRQGRTGS
ncbi:MAG: AraC family transcriptional regulator [Candidatus Marinimicrobia bacterium]|nr:AraC family transcriptional regulator [Candidatus Neomarinimicrobiota bacterium]